MLMLECQLFFKGYLIKCVTVIRSGLLDNFLRSSKRSFIAKTLTSLVD